MPLIPSWRLSLYALALGLGLGLCAGWKVHSTVADAEAYTASQAADTVQAELTKKLGAARKEAAAERASRVAGQKVVTRKVIKYVEKYASSPVRHDPDWVQLYNESAGFGRSRLDLGGDSNVRTTESIGVATRNNALCLEWRAQVLECKAILKELNNAATN